MKLQNSTIEFFIYQLVKVDEHGNEEIVDQVILDDCSNNLCIGGNGVDGNYYQYDSYEGYHSHSYFADNFNVHGLKIISHYCTVSAKDIKYE